MKTKTLTQIAAAGLLALALGCNNSDNGVVSPTDDATTLAADISSTETIAFETASFVAGGEDVADVDALFSVGWSEFYNPFEEEVSLRSDAFAIAPDTNLAVGRGRKAGKDMGTVSLFYGTESVELFKIEKRGGVFYNYGKRHPGNPRGMFHGDDGEVGDVIPFIAGETYRFEATGSDSFPAVSISMTAPAQLLTITSPDTGTAIDDSSELTVAWDGGDANSALMVSVVPTMSRRDFERERDGEGDGPGHGHGHGRGRGFDGPPEDHGPGRNPKFHLRYVIEENTGSFTVPAEDLAELLAVEGVKGLLIQVHQLITAEVQDGDATYAMQLRSGDHVRVKVAE